MKSQKESSIADRELTRYTDYSKSEVRPTKGVCVEDLEADLVSGKQVNEIVSGLEAANLLYEIEEGKRALVGSMCRQVSADIVAKRNLEQTTEENKKIQKERKKALKEEFKTLRVRNVSKYRPVEREGKYDVEDELDWHEQVRGVTAVECKGRPQFASGTTFSPRMLEYHKRRLKEYDEERQKAHFEKIFPVLIRQMRSRRLDKGVESYKKKVKRELYHQYAGRPARKEKEHRDRDKRSSIAVESVWSWCRGRAVQGFDSLPLGVQQRLVGSLLAARKKLPPGDFWKDDKFYADLLEGGGWKSIVELALKIATAFELLLNKSVPWGLKLRTVIYVFGWEGDQALLAKTLGAALSIAEFCADKITAESSDSSDGLGTIFFKLIGKVFGFSEGDIPKEDVEKAKVLSRLADMIKSGVVVMGPIVAAMLWCAKTLYLKYYEVPWFPSEADPLYAKLVAWKSVLERYKLARAQGRSRPSLHRGFLKAYEESYKPLHAWFNTVKEPEMKQWFLRLDVETEEMRTVASDAVNGVGGRVAPVMVLLMGPTSVGKSTLVEFLSKYIAVPLEWEHDRNGELVYMKSWKDQYWSKYADQPVVLLDEFLSVDCEDNVTEQSQEVLAIGNDVDYGLNMAELKDKGKFFTSKVVFATSNFGAGGKGQEKETLADIGYGPAFKLRAKDALFRRFTKGKIGTAGYDSFILRVRLLRMLEVDTDDPNDCWAFDVYIPENEKLRYANKTLSFNELCRAIVRQSGEKQSLVERFTSKPDFKKKAWDVFKEGGKIDPFLESLAESGDEPASPKLVPRRPLMDTIRPEAGPDNPIYVPSRWERFKRWWKPEKPVRVEFGQRNCDSLVQLLRNEVYYDFLLDDSGDPAKAKQVASGLKALLIGRSPLVGKHAIIATYLESHVTRMESHVALTMWRCEHFKVNGVFARSAALLSRSSDVVLEALRDRRWQALTVGTAAAVALVLYFALRQTARLVDEVEPLLAEAKGSMGGSGAPKQRDAHSARARAVAPKGKLRVTPQTGLTFNLDQAYEKRHVLHVWLKSGTIASDAYATYVENEVVMAPAHLFLKMMMLAENELPRPGPAWENATIEIENYRGADHRVTVPLRDIPFDRFFFWMPQDVVFIDLSVIHRRYPKIFITPSSKRRHFVTISDVESTLPYVENLAVMKPVPGTWDMNIVSIRYGGLRNMDPAEHAAVYYVEGLEFSPCCAIAYGLESGEGDCGLPYLGVGNSCPRKVLGFHVGSMKSEGATFATIVTREIVDQALEKLQRAVQPLVVEEIKHESGSAVTMSILEQLGEKVAVMGAMQSAGTSGKSKLAPSLLNCPTAVRILGEPKMAPARLTRFEKDGEMISPLEKAMLKLKPKPHDATLEEFRKVTSAIHLRWSPVPEKQAVPMILTLDQALSGIDGHRYHHSIEMSTAPGHFYKTVYKDFLKGAKGKYGLFDQVNNKIVPKEGSPFVKEYGRACYLSMNGRRVMPMYVNSLKDEKRPLEKVALGKTRVFSVGPCEYQVLMKQVYAWIYAIVQAHAKDAPTKLGINPYGPDWGDVFEWLRSPRDFQDVAAGDYGGFDGSTHSMIQESNFEVLEAMYREWALSPGSPWYERFWQTWLVVYAEMKIYAAQFGDVPDNPLTALWNILQSAKLDHCFSVQLLMDVVYQIDGSTPSGCYLTALLNALTNETVFRTAFSRVFGQKENFDDNVRLATAGDDNAFTVAPEVRDSFNALVMEREAARLGFEYTDFKKRATAVPFHSWDEIEFNKRRFVFRDGKIWGPLNWDSLTEMLFWRHKSMQPVYAMEETLRSYLIELTQYPREVYDEQCRKLTHCFAAIPGGDMFLPCLKRSYDTALREVSLPEGPRFYGGHYDMRAITESRRLVTPESRWTRDLTREGIESNPGPFVLSRSRLRNFWLSAPEFEDLSYIHLEEDSPAVALSQLRLPLDIRNHIAGFADTTDDERLLFSRLPPDLRDFVNARILAPVYGGGMSWAYNVRAMARQLSVVEPNWPCLTPFRLAHTKALTVVAEFHERCRPGLWDSANRLAVRAFSWVPQLLATAADRMLGLVAFMWDYLDPTQSVVHDPAMYSQQRLEAMGSVDGIIMLKGVLSAMRWQNPPSALTLQEVVAAITLLQPRFRELLLPYNFSRIARDEMEWM